jgi:hypothetical protein
MDHRGFEQFGGRQRRQQARQALGQHRLARTRRAAEEEVVTPGGGDLQRPLGVFLTFDVAQVEAGFRLQYRTGRRLAHHLRASEMVHQRDQRARREDGRIARPGRFRTAGFGTDEAKAPAARGDGGGQGPGHRHDTPVQGQLADRAPAVQAVRRDDAHGAHDGERDRQVVVAAFLGQVGGGEVHDDALARHGQAKARKRASNPLAAFADRLVAEADNDDGALAAGQLDLDVDAARFNPLKGDRNDPRDHAPPARSPATTYPHSQHGLRTGSRTKIELLEKMSWISGLAAPAHSKV